MLHVPLLVAAACGVLAAAFWALLGLRLLRRDHLPAHRAAGRAFAFAWLAGAGFSLSNAAVAAAIGLGAAPAWLVTAGAWAAVTLGLAMAGGFVAHIAHLLYGGRSVRVVGTLYAGALVGIVGLFLALGPTGVTTNGWVTRFEFARAPEIVNPIVAIVVVLPGLVGSLAYLSLLRHASSPTARWRVGLVGGAFTLWVLVALAGRFLTADALLAAARLLGAVAALATFVAYWPPAFAQRRWGVHSLRSEIVRPTPTVAVREAQMRALAQRVRELV